MVNCETQCPVSVGLRGEPVEHLGGVVQTRVGEHVAGDQDPD
jgi:tRNA(Ile2) C34 agmatinyltransferase TiaS